MSTSNDTNRIETGDLLIETNSSGDVEIHNLATGNSVTLGTNGFSAGSITADGATLNGDLQMGDLAEILFSLGGDIEAHTDSSATGEQRSFVIETVDNSGADTIWWRRFASNQEALSVYNSTQGKRLLRVLDDGTVALPYATFNSDSTATLGGNTTINGLLDLAQNHIEGIEYLDLYSRDGSGDNWRFITWNDTGNFVFQHYASGGGSTDAFEIDATGNVRFPNGFVTTSGGTVQQQRGAPTTTELADGERMQYVSDGTDAHSAGDLVSARNNAGTIVSQVIAAAADDA